MASSTSLILVSVVALIVAYLAYHKTHISAHLTSSQEPPLSSFTSPAVALIVLNWKRFGALRAIINLACTRKDVPFLREIIIWNNNPNRTVSVSHFPNCEAERIELRVVNSPGNARFVGRYYACAMAHSPVCMFQDDDTVVWQLRTLYAQLLRFPNNLHTIALSEVHQYEASYSFHNNSLGIHSGFAMVGFGGMVRKALVERFLQVMTLLKLKSHKISLFADVYLPILMNQHKYSLSSKVSVIEQRNSYGNDSVAVDNTNALFWVFKRLLRRLPDTKAMLDKHVNDTIDYRYLPRQEYAPLETRDARATCLSDSCILFSNLNPFDYPFDFPLYDAQPRHTSGGNSTCRPDVFYTRAVDYEPESSWSSRVCHKHSWEKIGQRGQKPYFGLDLLEEQIVSRIELHLSNDTDCAKQMSLYMAKSYDPDTGLVTRWTRITDFKLESLDMVTHERQVQKDDDDDDDSDDKEGTEKQDTNKPPQLEKVHVHRYLFKMEQKQYARFVKLEMEVSDPVCSRGLEVFHLRASNKKQQREKPRNWIEHIKKVLEQRQVDVYQ